MNFEVISPTEYIPARHLNKYVRCTVMKGSILLSMPHPHILLDILFGFFNSLRKALSDPHICMKHPYLSFHHTETSTYITTPFSKHANSCLLSRSSTGQCALGSWGPCEAHFLFYPQHLPKCLALSRYFINT